MSVTKADVDVVAYELAKLLRKVEAMRILTEDDEKKLVCLVRKCVNQVEDVSELSWSQAVSRMQTMKLFLQEACGMECSNWWYTQIIHNIKASVDVICLWQAVAVAGTKAREAAKAEAAAVAAARAARAERHVEARARVTVETRRQKGEKGEVVLQEPVMLTEEKRESVRAVVQAMQKNMFILALDVEGYSPGKKQMIKNVMAHQESCRGDETWIWNAEAWEAASRDLKSCQNYWSRVCGRDAPETNFRLKRECDACVHDMAQCKEMCTGSERKDATSPLPPQPEMRTPTHRQKYLLPTRQSTSCASIPKVHGCRGC